MVRGDGRRSRRSQAEVLWPTPHPMALGGRATVRYRAPRWWGDDVSRTVEAALRCVETVPADQITVGVERPCPTRVVATRPWFEAEIDVTVPLEGLPTSRFAGHVVTWSLELRDSAAPPELQVVDVTVQVAPVVAPSVLQGDERP